MTRAIRREMAACVQQLIRCCTRWPLQVRARRHDHWVLHPQGWPDCVDIVISVQDICLRVMHEDQFWDALLWLDVAPIFRKGHWQCNDESCTSTLVHARLRDLLWEHLCEPLLAYFQNLPQDAQLCLYGSELEGYTVAQIISRNSEFRIKPLTYWPIPEF